MAKRTSSTRKRTSRRPAPQRPRRKTRKAATRRPATKTRGSKARKPARPARRPAKARPVRKAAPRPARAAKARTSEAHPPTLTRERRRLPDAERTTGPDVDSRVIAEAKAGHDALARDLRQHTESSPVLTAGDLDAKWDDAYAVGDEAPGGDNPTPDQNEVDAIGRALGAEYDDDEELMGGEEIEERDEHRWELDPDSKDEDE